MLSHSPSDMVPDDFVCVDPVSRRPALPVALGAPKPDSLVDQSSRVVISDEEECAFSTLSGHLFSELSPAFAPEEPPSLLPPRCEPPPGVSFAANTPASPVSRATVTASVGSDASHVRPPLRDTILCHLCPTTFSGVDAKTRLRRHTEGHFQPSTPAAPRILGTFASRPPVIAKRGRRIEARISSPVVFRPVLIEPSRFPSQLASVCGDAHPPEDWGQQLELFSRSCRAHLSLVPAVEIFMRGLKVFHDLPSSVMRRVLRSFYDEDVTEHSLFKRNMLPVRHRNPASEASSRAAFVGPGLSSLPFTAPSRPPTSIVNDTDLPRTPGWEDPSVSRCAPSSYLP